MSDKTQIEWTEATWNIITGCSVVSAGCKHCYAMKLAGTRLQHHPSRTGLTIETANGPVWNGETRFNAEWLDQPLKWKRPRKIFVCAHGDLFHESVPDEWIDQVFAVMALAKQHTFQVLTKRPGRALKYLSQDYVTEGIECGMNQLLHSFPDYEPNKKIWPLPNVWLGVSVENQAAADERIPLLLQTPAAVRWISAEPLLGPISFRWAKWHDYSNPSPGVWQDQYDGIKGIDWVVVGGESGPNARPMHPYWARSLRDQCAAAGVPFLFKQWGEWAPRSGKLTGGGTDFSALDPECKKWPDIIRLGEHGLNTRISENCTDDAGEDVFVQKVGKKRAGRLLDGVEHNGYPNSGDNHA